MTRFVAGLTILGSGGGRAKEGRRELDEKHRHQIPTSSSSDARRLCIMQRGDSHGHTISAAYFTRCNGSHYSHNSQNFLKFFPLRIIEWWCLLSVIFDNDWQMRDEREGEEPAASDTIHLSQLQLGIITLLHSHHRQKPSLLLEMRQGKGGQEVSHCYSDI